MAAARSNSTPYNIAFSFHEPLGSHFRMKAQSHMARNSPLAFVLVQYFSGAFFRSLLNRARLGSDLQMSMTILGLRSI
ncbi:hypothetical protein TNCV_5031071 [Trichonephila clavipes]|nr:hypothetical protein TNCV_5031071 [Trichonephila clavipes]